LDELPPLKVLHFLLVHGRGHLLHRQQHLTGRVFNVWGYADDFFTVLFQPFILHALTQPDLGDGLAYAGLYLSQISAALGWHRRVDAELC
jgi:hypothetical protein